MNDKRDSLQDNSLQDNSPQDNSLQDNSAATAPGDDEPGVRVKAHPGLCLGYGNCHRFAPDVYSLDEEGMIDVHLLEVPPSLAFQAWIGATVCPERAITVIGPDEDYWRKRQRAESAAAHTPNERKDPLQ